MQVPLIRLQCGANSYEWGKKGSASAVARFAAATPSANFAIEEDRPYAEVCFNSLSLAVLCLTACANSGPSSYGWEHIRPTHPRT